MDVAGYDGSSTADSITSYSDWFWQYTTMITSRVAPTQLGFTSDWKAAAETMLDSGTVPIMVLHAKSHKFLEDSAKLAKKYI
jgi:hypothetical protein